MKLERIFENTDVDAILLMNSTEPHLDLSFFYLTGLKEGLFEGCVALATRDSLEVLVSSLEEESAKMEDFEICVFKTKKEREKILREKLSQFKRIGVNAVELTYGDYLKLEKLTDAEFVDVSDSLKRTRVLKTEEELRRIRKACDIVSEVAERIPELVFEGMREYELATELSYLLRGKGAQDAFTPIVCFGKNSSKPHHSPKDTKLKRGDFILCDLGAKYERYISDLTRTLFFKRISERQKKMYETVLSAQREALRIVRHGVEAKKPHLKAREIIDSGEFKDTFIHGFGHSIGLSVHDGYAMNSEANFDLEEGMVFTAEPGVYLPDYGGVRIEDNILVKREGVEVLTSASREICVV
ncbi:MAG: M24 family metallopeptidase [Candidatus Methanofastidiosia archaeon]